MAAVGGDVIQMNYNHPTIGSGVFFFKANEDGTINPGGLKNNDDANQVTGDGRIILQKNRSLGSFETPPIEWDMVGANELEILRDLAESSELTNWTITLVSGAIFGGKGTIVGDIPGSTNTATIPIKIHFEGNGPKRQG